MFRKNEDTTEVDISKQNLDHFSSFVESEKNKPMATARENGKKEDLKIKDIDSLLK